MAVNEKNGTDSPQVVVIGGGPAGSTAATLLAQRGLRVRLLERERFPRFHIGESLMPETYWVFRRLGLLDKMQASRFVKKYSVQFVNDTGKESQPFYFFENNPHECSQTWQVLRSEFDQMLLDNAREHGVDVRQGTRVLDVLFDGDRGVGVRTQDENGRQEELRAQVVVDASGQSTLIANRLKLRQPDPFLKKATVWTYYEGAHRDPGLDEGATLVLHTAGKKGWFWYIPQHNNMVSVGVVSSLDYLFKNRGDHEKIFYEEVECCSAVKRRLAVGRRATGFYSTKDFSYRATRVAGDGWVLVGDAFGFLDPIYSSGVFLALKSGELAADAVAEGFAKGDLSAAQLGYWGPAFIEGMERMKRLVYAFYEGFSFGQFIRKHPDLKRHIVDLLTGDLFKDSVDAVWEPMAELQREMDPMACSA
ncbi:MAG TPA: NAD(P)/FAD-dependent oxidoreductase [Gemmataceae bacterium]|nr:NAD(P)/FAD-dependent oxidoreductase [Gemmataceae bacterium]